jgi:AraC-like DNA-binding protein
MSCEFSVMVSPLQVARGPIAGGKVVLSRLKPSSSPIGAPAPSLKLILEGDGRYEVDGRGIVVRPGEFLYLDAGSACIATNRTDTVGLCLLLPHAPVAPEGDRIVGADPVLGRAFVLSTRTSAVGRTLHDYGRRIAQNPALGPALAGELVARVERAIAEPLAESRAAMEGLKAAKPQTRRELYRRLERARDFLHDNDYRNVTLSEMANAAGLSQFHLARYFKAAFGRSPILYHRAVRLERAAEILAAGGRSVADVAEATGYSDQVALSHAFRRHYGQPPQSWAMGRRPS